MAAFREHQVRAQDGLLLSVRDYPGGRATPLFCLAGLSRNAADFDALARWQAPQRRVVAFDYRGRGKSGYDRSTRSYRPQVYLQDARQVQIALGLERVVYCGTSLGGFLTMGAAALMPITVAGAILNDSGPELAPGGVERILGYLRQMWQAPPADLSTTVTYLRQLLPQLRFQSDQDWQDFARNSFQEVAGRLEPIWDRGLLRALARAEPLPDLWALFAALVPFPTLVLRGEGSDLLKPDTLTRMAAAHPQLRSVTVPGTAHAPTLAEPESRAAIETFLAEIE